MTTVFARVSLCGLGLSHTHSLSFRRFLAFLAVPSLASLLHCFHCLLAASCLLLAPWRPSCRSLTRVFRRPFLFVRRRRLACSLQLCPRLRFELRGTPSPDETDASRGSRPGDPSKASPAEQPPAAGAHGCAQTKRQRETTRRRLPYLPTYLAPYILCSLPPPSPSAPLPPLPQVRDGRLQDRTGRTVTQPQRPTTATHDPRPIDPISIPTEHLTLYSHLCCSRLARQGRAT